MYEEGYRYWRRFSDQTVPSSHDWNMQPRLWGESLQAAGGLRELLTADIRSVQPGLWSDRWELPWPYVRRQKVVVSYPKECLSYERAAAETVTRAVSSRTRIQSILDRTSSTFGCDALINHELQERLNFANQDSHDDCDP